MKTTLTLTGIIISIYAMATILGYFLEYHIISGNETSYITGNFILLLIGLVLLLYARGITRKQS
ncbi:hypothetical protein SAMN02927921_01383 [Sinomicrobium oceani]|uniref:Uncharacterized protein n=1 Tax=Sinomicrobium oceani TaxID=1150368 RepID=A0A1K1NQT4_9FLAO|nr:hypothetical protein [Sinomicrobium oceani]SFW37611.1 hypothetical protein SAMN02927921_01383 [Sinomicrobium oceani]